VYIQPIRRYFTALIIYNLIGLEHVFVPCLVGMILGHWQAKFDRTSRAKGAATMATPATVSGSQLDADGQTAHDPAATTFSATPSACTSSETRSRPVDEPTRTGHVQSVESVEVDTPAAR
jgi:hypothetical protein